MAKSTPEDRWREHTIERFIAFEHSGELVRLRKKGLHILNRKKRFTVEEWWKGYSNITFTTGYQEWHNECTVIGEKFGLAPWTVVCSCLISRYNPANESFPIESKWPRIRIITDSTNSNFLHWLSFEAFKLGLYVVQKQGPMEETIISLAPPNVPLTKSDMPPRESAFYINFEIPVGYPPEGAENFYKHGLLLSKELMNGLGYSVPQRLRNSPLVKMTDQLKIEKHRLGSSEVYDIVDDIYGTDDLENDNKNRKLIASRRNKLHNRLEKPYKSDI